MAEITTSRSRITSIDILRGLVMVIMALDHVRDFFHIHGADNSPTNLAVTSPALFFTRFITHFCAPVFVFLAGTSGFLQGLRKSKKELSLFLIKRGFWLVLVELFIVTLGITFDITYQIFILQVIWAIGISMIILGLLVRTSYTTILVIGLIIVFGHNLLDYPESDRTRNLGLVWNLMHAGFFYNIPIGGGRQIIEIYPFLPWTGIMLLGYSFGKLYGPEISPAQRKKMLIYIGSAAILLFFILRGINSYGDPFQWGEHPRGLTYTILSFFNATKYPPSLVFTCMTIGPAILALAFIEGIKNRVTAFFMTYGRVPFFYYILHFYLIHLVCMVFYYSIWAGTYPVKDPRVPFLFRPFDDGFPLWVVYVIWIAIVLALYPLCRWYDRYKTANIKERWWLSYV
jgi:uncharacterized membrane protein